MGTLKKNKNSELDVFIGFIRNIIKRPALYKIEEVEQFETFILGYLTASDKLTREAISDFMNGFNKYVRKKHSIKSDAYNWSRIIRFYSSGNRGSIDLFEITFNNYCDKLKI